MDNKEDNSNKKWKRVLNPNIKLKNSNNKNSSLISKPSYKSFVRETQRVNTAKYKIHNSSETPKVLVIHPISYISRLIRESLESFADCSVDTTPSSIRGFELAIEVQYKLIFISTQLDKIDGYLLYDFIYKANNIINKDFNRKTSGSLILINDEKDINNYDINKDIRIKGVITKPIKIERILDLSKDVLKLKDPTEINKK